MPAKKTMLKSPHKKSSNASILNTRIYRSKTQKNIPFITEKLLPAGKYIAKVIAVHEAISNSGDEAIDLCYEFTDSNDVVVEAKERCVIGSYHYERLGEALLDAGLPEGATLADAVGLCEDVYISFPRKGALGIIQQRSPHKSTAVPFSSAVPSVGETDDDSVATDDTEIDAEFEDDFDDDDDFDDNDE